MVRMTRRLSMASMAALFATPCAGFPQDDTLLVRAMVSHGGRVVFEPREYHIRGPIKLPPSLDTHLIGNGSKFIMHGNACLDLYGLLDDTVGHVVEGLHFHSVDGGVAKSLVYCPPDPAANATNRMHYGSPGGR